MKFQIENIFSGFAEIIKCGLIENNKIFSFLKRNKKTL